MTSIVTDLPDIQLRGPDGTLYSEPLPTERFIDEKLSRILLIHGFRNTEGDAFQSYKDFYATLSRYSAFFAEHLFYVIWPGDIFPWNPTHYFAENVQNALVAGQILARYLHKRTIKEAAQGIDCELIVVAHSLGCRLASEMMAELRRMNSIVCNKLKLVLMAGAVATIDVENKDVYGSALLSAKYVATLYSPDDKVLGRLFPIGELDRLGQEAIGFKGGPLGFGWSMRQKMQKFDHGDNGNTAVTNSCTRVTLAMTLTLS
jgi:pimeloyl-ACP methyl ester carboxylesterase